MDNPAPPLASVSNFVNTAPSNFSISWKFLAWSTASFPANASPTKRVRCGFATLLTFSSSAIKLDLFCILPAVSTRTTSIPFAFAESIASLAIAAESPPLWEETQRIFKRSQWVSNCSIAPALNVSPAAAITEWPRFCNKWAILATVVVLPVPFTPTNIIDTGVSPLSMKLWMLSKKSQ